MGGSPFTNAPPPAFLPSSARHLADAVGDGDKAVRAQHGADRTRCARLALLVRHPRAGTARARLRDRARVQAHSRTHARAGARALELARLRSHTDRARSNHACLHRLAVGAERGSSRSGDF
eukprot:916739-Pleurochrysis_carterae.AAC.2